MFHSVVTIQIADHRILHGIIAKFVKQAVILNAFAKVHQGYRSIFGFCIPFGREIGKV